LGKIHWYFAMMPQDIGPQKGQSTSISIRRAVVRKRPQEPAEKNSFDMVQSEKSRFFAQATRPAKAVRGSKLRQLKPLRPESNRQSHPSKPIAVPITQVTEEYPVNEPETEQLFPEMATEPNFVEAIIPAEHWELPKRRKSKRGIGYSVVLVAILGFGFWWQHSRLEKLVQNSSVIRAKSIDFIVYRPAANALATVIPETYSYDGTKGIVTMMLKPGSDGSGKVQVTQQKRPSTLGDNDADYRRFVVSLGTTVEVDTSIGKGYFLDDDRGDGASSRVTIVTSDSLIEINNTSGTFPKTSWDTLIAALKPMSL
jgi:hypothetical protein